MPLATGDKLGPYEILSAIGAGGMGEVYEARDTLLKRDVALKVLPTIFASDVERLARFRREAELLASLDHPNIGPIYGIVQAERVWALVLALIDGPTLAEHIAKGPLPPGEAIGYAKQIIDAMEYAHDHGVIHRDLKPANIKVTPDGVVKVLDFGLAKALDQSGAATSLDPENSPTLTMGATQAGMIMGTAAYMSPEQAVGKATDRRSDIFSLGVVLFEMLTGKRPFQGQSTGETLAAVVKDIPDWSTLPPRTPAHLRQLLERMLVKDRKDRLQAVGEARIALARGEQSPVQDGRPPRQSVRVAWAVAAFASMVLATLGFVYYQKVSPQEQTVRSYVAAPENSSVHSFAISPDGRSLVIAAAVNGKRQLWLRRMDAQQAQPVQSTDEGSYPFWSPDSRYIGFFAQGKLKIIAAEGGPASPLCDAILGRGGSWNRDGIIVFSPGVGLNLQSVSAAGGVPVDVTKVSGDIRHPVFLPDGRHFLYSLRAAKVPGIFLTSLDGISRNEEPRRILPDVSGVVVAPARRGGSAHILFTREDSLMAASFDARTLQLSGEAFAVTKDFSITTDTSYLPATASENGVLLYQTGGESGGTNQLGWYDRAGKLVAAVGAPGPVFDPALSPDEKSVAFRKNEKGGASLWIRDLIRGAESRFAGGAGVVYSMPFWSPAGDRILFSSNRDGGIYGLYRRTIGGSGPDETLLAKGSRRYANQWSKDDRFIVYSEVDAKMPQNKEDLWVLPLKGDPAPQAPIPFLRTEFNETHGQLSPDGHWMSYTSDRTGRWEVYVRPFPSVDREWTISLAGGKRARWRSDGKELFFEATDGKLMAVPIRIGKGEKPSLEAGTPAALFDAHLEATSEFNFQYDIASDGQRFLLATADSGGSTPLTLVTNWSPAAK